MNAGLPIDLLLKHLLSSFRVVDIVFDFFLSEIPVDEFDLPGDFVLDSILVIFLEFLLFQKHLADFFT